MKYIVLEDFTDVKDKRKIYRKGDRYPSPANKKVDQKRLDELSSTKNKIGAPLIKKAEDEMDTIEDETEEKPEKKKPARKKATKVTTEDTEVKNEEQEQG